MNVSCWESFGKFFLAKYLAANIIFLFNWSPRGTLAAFEPRKISMDLRLVSTAYLCLILVLPVI